MKKLKNVKKQIGPLLAVVVFVILLLLGFILGKSIAYAYNKKHGTDLGIFEIITIEKSNVPINYILKENPKTIQELCGKDTGICDGEVGTLTLEQIDTKLHVYANFDNPNEAATTYFKIGNKKISSFIYIDSFAILDSKYLVVTEPNSDNNNYIVRIYNYKGTELMNYDATDLTSYDIKAQNLYFDYCSPDETREENGETLNNYIRYKVNSKDVLKPIIESSNYQKC